MFTWVAATAAGSQVLAASSNGNDIGSFGLLFFLSGFVFYGLMYLRYRNTDKRHMHARETDATIDNVRVADDFLGRRTQLSNKHINGANERQVEGSQASGLVAGLFRNASGGSVRRIFSSFK